MAAVLFVVTIPTEAEESRLKNEFIVKKLDLRSDQVDVKFASQPTTIVEVNDDEETSSATTMPATPVTSNQSGTVQYGTFPKRRKSETTRPELTINDMLNGTTTPTTTNSTTTTMMMTTTTTGAKSQTGGDGSSSSSLRDIDVEVTDAPPAMRKSWEGLRDILSSTKRKSQKKKETPFNLDTPSDTSMEFVLREILKKYQIANAVWTKDTEGRMYQIIFSIEFNETYERVLEKFYDWGIGDREGSTVSVMNCIASKTFARKDDFEQNDDLNRENENAQKQGAWERFMNSVQSRLNVAQIIRDVRQDASITFDFVILLISAAILASFGLVEDSTIFLASSMLISPLMGPIIAGIFGTVIKDHSLRALGMKNELFGILMATFVGFLFGMVVCTTDERYGIGEGLTSEMLSRCELHSLLVGLFTAIPSGAAAAISILGGNIGSLVGVAISASLLPPAVNSGLLWALACIYKFFETDESRYPNVVKTNFYSNNQATELAILGSISMCLTISNVLCVYVMGILVLKIKEIAPVISRNNRQFWKHDIKIARDLNRNGYDSDNAIIDEFANLPKEDQKVLGMNCDFLRNIHLDEAAYQNTWSPIGSRHPFETTYEPVRENYSTVHRFERLYSTITRQQSMNERRHRFSIARRPTGRVSDMGTTYKILTENLPRCATMPSNVACPSVSIVTPTGGTGERSVLVSDITSDGSTPTGMSDEKKRRKFIVTPAVDPLHFNAATTDDVDV